MMGKDCERILLGINTLKDTIKNEVRQLVTLIDSSPIEIVNVLINNEGYGTRDRITLMEGPIDTFDYSVFDRIEKGYDAIKDDIVKMNSLRSDLYIPAEEFNNSYGSPWKELTNLQECIDQILSYKKVSIVYISKVIALTNMLNLALSYAIDAKMAITMYHDYIQRGFDSMYNNHVASIQFTTGYGSKTIGNVDQNYDENVNIEPKSIDPF